MKTIKHLFYVFFIALFFCCGSDNDTGGEDNETSEYDKSVAHNLSNISYGPHERNVMDIYLPANRNAQTKTFFLIHGGGWNSGSKEDFNFFVDIIKVYFPNHAIVNINYRLATETQPAYPMQIDDIRMAVNEILKSEYEISSELFMVGASAGSHLAMLYGFRYDTDKNVKGIANFVGPVDFTDPSYTENPIFEYGLIYLIGHEAYEQNSDIVREVSPVFHITSQSPPIISFYGSDDPLIPATQMGILNQKLSAMNVAHSSTMYQGGHGNDWSEADMADCVNQFYLFAQEHFK